MAQHFLLSAQARTLSLRSIFAGGEDRAYETFRKLRWPETDGEPVCPHCGSLDSYEISTRRKFKCAACRRQFSVTSGTIFASRKMSFTDLLAAICIVMNAAKGISALQLSRDLDCQAKTAFVLAHKIREAIAAETADASLSGDVEVDGAYFGGHVRPENRKEDRKGVAADGVDLQVRANPSIGLATALVLVQLNRQLQQDDGTMPRHYDRYVKHFLAKRGLVARQGDEPRLGLDEDWVRKRGEQQVKRLKSDGHRVVGDLDELRPLPVPGIHADEVSVEDRLAAAVDGLEHFVEGWAKADRSLRKKARRASSEAPA